MGVLNLLTDLALILLPVHVVAVLQMSMGKKLTILTFFGARILYVANNPDYCNRLTDVGQRYGSNKHSDRAHSRLRFCQSDTRSLEMDSHGTNRPMHYNTHIMRSLPAAGVRSHPFGVARRR